MADLSSDFVGIKSPNPFWLASAPPTDKEYNVRRAFEAGWGGVVWKTPWGSTRTSSNGQRAALRRDLGRRPAASRPQQHRASSPTARSR